MKKKYDCKEDDLRPEYDVDYSKAVWGKYSRKLKEEGSNVVLLKPDVAKVFKDSETVNEALRYFIKASELVNKKSAKSRKAVVKHKSAAN